MSYFEVTSQELKNKAGELQNLNSRFQTEIENLVSYQTNLNSMWEGEAKDAFNNVFNQDKGNMDNFKVAIDQYIQALSVIAERYEETEKKNVTIVNTRSF